MMVVRCSCINSRAMEKRMHVDAHTSPPHIYTHTHTNTHTHTHTHAYIHTYTHTTHPVSSIHSLHTHTPRCVHNSSHSLIPNQHKPPPPPPSLLNTLHIT